MGSKTRGVVVAALAFVAMTGAAFAQAARAEPPWVLNLGVQEAYESNSEYGAVEGEDEFVTHAGARLGRRFPVKRGGLEVDLDAGATVYHRLTGLNRFTWGAAAVGTRRLSRRALLQVEARSSLGFARDNARLDETGLLPPNALTRSDSGAISLRHHFSRTLEGHLEGRGERFEFDSPALPDGSSVRVRSSLDRLGRGTSRIGLSAEYERTSSFHQTIEIERLFGGWSVAVARGVSLSFEAGVGRYRPIGSSGGTFTPTGALGAARRFGRHAVSARLARRIEQTYGLGTVGVSRIVSVGYGFALGARLGLFANAYDVRVNGSSVTDVRPEGRSVSAGTRYDLTRRLTARATYSYASRANGLDERRSHTVMLSLSRRLAWR